MSCIHKAHVRHRGAVLVLSMIVIAMLSALAVALASASGVNIQLAENQRKVDHTRSCAETRLPGFIHQPSA